MADETVVEQEVPVVEPVIEPLKQVKDENISDLPYHTKETEKLAEERIASLPVEPAPYEFKANGYTVKEAEVGKLEIFMVTADGFEKGFASQREAEIYVTTHAPLIKS